jgi:hypothetical protein
VFEMSEVKDVIISPSSEPVIAETETVISSGDEEIIDKMSRNFDEFEVYEEPYHFTRGVEAVGSNGVETDEQWLNAPDYILKGTYYNTFGGGPEGGYFVADLTTISGIGKELFFLERSWGTKFKWTAIQDRELERQPFQDGDTFIKDNVRTIRIWKKCPMPVFKTANDWEDTACSPIGYKKLSLPFFLMGSPGVANARTSIAWLQRPKAINQAFLLRVADKLEKNPCRDWDWDGFQKNLILPNFDHIQIHHKITDSKVMSRWVEDLYVFLNNANEKDTVERKRGQPNKIHLAPSIKNINNPADIEY